VKAGFLALQEDLETTEDGGAMDGADPGAGIGARVGAGKQQLGTRVPGNHFMELKFAGHIRLKPRRKCLVCAKGRSLSMIHCRFRAVLGYQNLR